MKKKTIIGFVSLSLAMMLGACSSDKSMRERNSSESTQLEEANVRSERQQAETSKQSVDSKDFSEANILIAYLSVPETEGVDTVAGASRVSLDGEVLGNNQYVAETIQQTIGGDLFAIETAKSYPGTHEELLDFAEDERAEEARPSLRSQVENFEKYDIIFLGYPIWYADLPMPMYTFFEENDFSGKIIIPFTVHGGSGFAGTISTISELAPNATIVEDELSISRNVVPDSQVEVVEWVNRLSFN